VLNHDERLIYLSRFLHAEVYELVKMHSDTLSKSQQTRLSLILIKCIELLHIPFNSDDTNELVRSLNYIRVGLCQQYEYRYARDWFRRIRLLVEHMMNEGCFKKAAINDLRSQMCAMTRQQYSDDLLNKMPMEVSVKLKRDLSSISTQQIGETSPTSLNVQRRLEFLCSFLNKDISDFITDFVRQSSKERQTQLTFVLVTYIAILDDALNESDVDKLIQSMTFIRIDLCRRHPLSVIKQKVTHLKVFVKEMVRVGYFQGGSTEKLFTILGAINESQYEMISSQSIPKSVSAKFMYDFARSGLSYGKSSHTPTPSVQQRLEYLSSFLNSEIAKLIVHFIYRSNKERQTNLTFKLVTYIRVLHQSFNTKDVTKLVQNLTYTQIDLCKRHTYLTAQALITSFQLLVQHILNSGYFGKKNVSELTTFLIPINESIYESYRSKTIPTKVTHLFSHQPSVEQNFKHVLNSCCTKDIARRLEEHVNSYKKNVRKSHRTPLINFLTQISASDPEWYKHPRVIQGELLKFRAALLDKLQRNTAYSMFQNVKNCLKTLVEHGLLPQSLELPNNLRRCTNTEKVRSNNPLLCNIDMYDVAQQESYINTPKFIEHLKGELSSSLSTLVCEAQEIIHQAYQKFSEKESFIEASQFNEFINHPQLLVDKTEGGRSQQKLNPFYKRHPLRLQNLTAYYDHFFDDLTHGEKRHNVPYLRPNDQIIEYLGLTAYVASAMQIVITEELGTNPYSLYKVKTSSNSLEFVQIDDNGSVRIKAIKRRARHARTRNAEGTHAPLADISAKEIDAATCLKMALDMTSKARASLGVKNLWVCLTRKGATVANVDSFQKQFKKIAALASSKNAILKNATLKKVRSSKGVLIYLETNGDSLKAATYYGNTVKTTLNRYIPKYLSELIYRVKIRNFQKVVLFMAVSSDEAPSNSLNMSEEDFTHQLKRAFSNPDMGGDLYEKLSNVPIKDQEDGPIYFCVSDSNLQLAIKYAKYGVDEELKKNCQNVISKIGEESPISMKIMLRKAQKVVQEQGLKG